MPIPGVPAPPTVESDVAVAKCPITVPSNTPPPLYCKNGAQVQSSVFGAPTRRAARENDLAATVNILLTAVLFAARH